MVRLVLLRVLESYFRHRWLYLVPILILTCIGIAVAVTAKEQYISSGVMYVQEDSFLADVTGVRREGFDWLSPASRTTLEINDLLETDTFVRGVIAQTSLESRMSGSRTLVLQTVFDVRQALRATEQGENQLWVIAEWEDPAVAYELANATIENYIQWHINTDLQDSIAAESFFDDLIETYRTDLIAANLALEAYLVDHPLPLRGERSELETLEITRLQSDINLASSRFALALDNEEISRLATVQTESDVRQTYFVLDAPEIPTNSQRSLRSMGLNVIIFAAVGALLSGGALIANALIDRSYRFPIDAWHTLDLPVLAMVPNVEPKQRRFNWGRKKATVPEEVPVAPAPTLTPVFTATERPAEAVEATATESVAEAKVAKQENGASEPASSGDLSNLLWGSSNSGSTTPAPALSSAED